MTVSYNPHDKRLFIEAITEVTGRDIDMAGPSGLKLLLLHAKQGLEKLLDMRSDTEGKGYFRITVRWARKHEDLNG